jgi:hypothetical protein
MERRDPCWQLEPLLAIGQGLKVFAFHPIHIYLNAADVQLYQALKQKIPRISEAPPDALREYVQAGNGAYSLFTELIGHLAIHGRSLAIRDIYDHWQRRKENPKECRANLQ